MKTGLRTLAIIRLLTAVLAALITLTPFSALAAKLESRLAEKIDIMNINEAKAFRHSWADYDQVETVYGYMTDANDGAIIAYETINQAVYPDGDVAAIFPLSFCQNSCSLVNGITVTTYPTTYFDSYRGSYTSWQYSIEYDATFWAQLRRLF